jgi:phosphate acyltransferase
VSAQPAITIAVDAMSGDHGAGVAVPASCSMAGKYPDVTLTIVGRADDLRAELNGAPQNVRQLHAAEVVAMQDHPRDALRRKKDSSMRRAIDLVKAGEAQACVSAGNTGALVATAHFVLKMLPGAERPAIISPIPNRGGGHTFVLDLGANTTCTAEQLCQFAVMGSVVASDFLDRPSPRVGLLNVGEEDIKGHEVVKEAHQLIAARGLDYAGFVEGDDIFTGDLDVIVTDGFTGNVALKCMEGLAGLITAALKEEFTRNGLRKLGAVAATPALNALKVRLDPRRYNGASIVGLNGIVIKSHGGADHFAFERAIETAILEARKGVPSQIATRLRT